LNSPYIPIFLHNCVPFIKKRHSTGIAALLPFRHLTLRHAKSHRRIMPAQNTIPDFLRRLGKPEQIPILRIDNTDLAFLDQAM
jgi:hypothetical protein